MDYKLSDLETWDERILEIASKYGLDPFPIEYEFVDYFTMIGAMSFHGLPSHFNHWSFGKSFERTHYMYNMGAEGLPYELILNSNPSLAYMMRENPLYLQILIMAHCVGHSDFFKNNRTFRDTRPETIVGRCRAAKKRIQSYVEDPTIGIDKVESTIDACNAIQFQVTRPGWIRRTREEIISDHRVRMKQNPSLPELDLRKNPLEFDYDILGFISENAKLPEWKRDIIEVCRDEGKYFWPQIQTKTINEGWACVTGDTLIDTPEGLITAKELVENATGTVYDGNTYQALTAWHHNPHAQRVKITTNLGYVIHGSVNHRIWSGIDWVYLKDLNVADMVTIAKGNNTWASEEVRLTNPIVYRRDIEEICRDRGVSYRQVRKYVNGKFTKASLEKLTSARDALEVNKKLHLRRNDLKFPETLCEKTSNIIGMLIGDGGFWRYGDGRLKCGLTTGDDQLSDLFCQEVQDVFGVRPVPKRDVNKWRIDTGSELISEWMLNVFNFSTGNTASKKFIPPQIMRSPKHVVKAFMRGLFDTDGCADKYGSVIYVTVSSVLARQVHEILLKFGIVSKLSHTPSKNPNHQDGYRITISGVDADTYRREIGFNLSRKQERLLDAATNKCWWKKKDEMQRIVSIEFDEGEVYDFTVENTHKYRASAFMNHNSYWHYTILNDLDLPTDLHVAFLKSHNQVVRPHVGGINPYHLGFHLFQRLKERKGMSEMFLAREVHNDASFIRQYLTQEDCEDLNLFSYSKKVNGDTTIDDVSDEIGWEQIKNDLVKQVGGGSIPVLYVNNIRRDGALVLGHEHDGRDLHIEETRAVLYHIKYLWNEDTVALNTFIDGAKYGFDI